MENSQKESSNIKEEEFEEFEEPLAQPGRIFSAEIHGSAQRFLKIKKLSKYIRFCKCCLLPSETPGVVVPYTCLDNLEDFGIGLHLYFVYIKFCIVITFIGLCLGAIPTMIFSKDYKSDINSFCDKYISERLDEILYHYYNSSNPSDFDFSSLYDKIIIEECMNFEDAEGTYFPDNSDNSDIIKTEWLTKFNADNVITYYKLLYEIDDENKYADNVLLNFSFVYFLTSIVLLIINFFFIHYVNLINDKEDFESTTPRDYTLLIKGVYRPDDKTTKLQHLENIINEISKDYFELKLQHIIPCYNLVKLYKLTKDVFEDKIRIYHAYNFKRQKDLHKIYSGLYHPEKECSYDRTNTFLYNNISNNNDKINNDSSVNYIKSQSTHKISNKNVTWFQLNQYKDDVYIHDEKLNYYSTYLWKIIPTPLNEIERRMAINRKKIQEIENDLEKNPDKYSSGTYFVVFKYIIMKDRFFDFFPTHIFSKLFLRIKYFFQNIIFSKCVSEKTKRTNYLRREISVSHATEAYEIIWQNMGYNLCQKTLYLMLSMFVTIILIGISFGIVLGLNFIQYNLDNNSERIYEYLISLVISIIISLINSLGRKLLKLVTRKFEAIETKTDYYISLSVKITIFTFINTNIVPLLSNYIHSKRNENDILLNNILMIFISNFALNPFVFYLNPNLLIKLFKRAKARKKIEGLPLKDSIYTQDELNRLFQNPSMSLCYKYSFFSNVVLTSFFYLSILPLGIVFSIFGLIVSYFLEIVHLQFYKRPEVLNSKLCKFFINHFNVALAVFALGNFIFLRDAEKNFSPNWNLINLILFIIIMFIPYHSFKINLLGIKEGEVTKGSYDEYELMFPTDYEKQNPLTKKKAMIKYFKKLRKMNEIDDIQSNFLINSINKESSMVNYYKTSRNVGNILNYYEFQNQFVRLQKRSKYIKEAKLRKRKINKYDIFINQKARERRATLLSMNTLPNNRMRSSSKKTKNNINNNINNNNINNNINNNPPVLDRYSSNNDLDDYSNLGYNKQYKIKGLMESNPKLRRRISSHMRSALIQNIKEQGLYSATEEDSDDDEESFISEGTSKIISNLNLRNSNKKSFDKFKEDEKN